MKNDLKSKKIAILGAGPSGLVAAKEALENGMIPTIFEKEANLGGVWNLDTGCVWNTMHTNISKFTTTYGDTHWSSDTDMFPSVQSMFSYLSQYSVKWKIEDFIQYNSNVVNVSSNVNELNAAIGSNGWTVRWIDDNGLTHSDSFDGVIVATGIFAKGNIPELRGVNTFPGKIIHSKDYKSGISYEGLRVLTIGGSFSGAEIASDVSNYCSVSYHCFREHFWILRRYLPDTKRSQNIPLDLLFYTRKSYSQPKPTSKEATFNSRNEYMASICQEQQNISELSIATEEFHKPYNTVVSDQYLSQVNRKKLIPRRQNISEINGSTVVFENGETLQVDAIILATGFQPDISFFDEIVLEKVLYDRTDRLQPIILFNECCHPDLENLFFVGMYKGPYFAVMEQQARFAARVLSGSVALPPIDVLMNGLEAEKNIRDAIPRLQFPHPEYVFFADEISKTAHSFPDLTKFASNDCTLSEAFKLPLPDDAQFLEKEKSEIYSRFMTEPVTASHYNLVRDPIKTLRQMDLVKAVLNSFS